MKKIVLLRHGESLWNQENRFTGWTNVDLSQKGVEEANNAGKLLKGNNFSFEIAYTSYLKRAIKTLNSVLDQMDEDWIPVHKTWRLNEKHYGILQGLNKSETAAIYEMNKSISGVEATMWHLCLWKKAIRPFRTKTLATPTYLPVIYHSPNH